MSSDDRIPPARVVKGGETVGTDTEQMWQPSQTGDNADDHPKVIANHLRALTREMRDGFDGIGRALVALTRIDEKLDVVIDRQNVLERRQDAADAERAELARRITALESIPVARVVRPRKKRK
jgi:hypothetical protein